MAISTEQLAFELEQLQQGNCWIGNNAVEILEGIDAQKAQFRAFPEGNNIWQILNHISHWREVVTRRISFSTTPEDEITGMDAPAQPGPEDWNAALARFDQSFQQLKAAILAFPEEKLDEIRGSTAYRSSIMGIIEHDAYHLGQIILLKRMQEALTT